jgi:hypothetical protein
MKIIFLDIDGVIVTGKSFNDRCEVDANCIRGLNRLTDEDRRHTVHRGLL